MLCSDCKKNMAVIYINKLDEKNMEKPNEVIGLCVPCAKKRGIDPMGTMSQSLNNMSQEDIDKLSKQFENMFSNLDMDKLSNMFGGMGFSPEGGMDIPFSQDESEDEEGQKSASKTKVKEKVK